VDIWEVTLWAHLVGAAIWVGGSIVMMGVGPVMLAGGAKEKLMRSVFESWMYAAWIGMVLAVGTGIVMTLHQDLSFTSSAMGLKMALIAAAAVVAVLDGWLLFRSPAWVQTAGGIFLLIFNLGIFGAAVAL
jgi:hypothetical protein